MVQELPGAGEGKEGGGGQQEDDSSHGVVRGLLHQLAVGHRQWGCGQAEDFNLLELRILLLCPGTGTRG